MQRITYSVLEQFVLDVLQKKGASLEYAKQVTDVLIESDVRNIASHGVARLKRYVGAIDAGHIIPKAEPIIEKQSFATATVDAQNGFGQVAGIFAMKEAITLASKYGIGAVSVKNSNHYGIAGYYSEMALPMLGISLTNSEPLVVPTYGNKIIFGTNPIAIACPGDTHPWSMDFATSIVPRGKIEIAEREEKTLPASWAVDKDGNPASNPSEVLEGLLNRTGGGINPLGEHKGYGFAMFIEILCGVLSGASFGSQTYTKKHPNIGHFFIVIDIEKFMPKDEFSARMKNLIAMLKDSHAEGKQVFIHGEKEYVAKEENAKLGVPVNDKVYENLKNIGAACGVNAPF